MSIKVGPGKFYIAVDYDGPGWLHIGDTDEMDFTFTTGSGNTAPEPLLKNRGE